MGLELIKSIYERKAEERERARGKFIKSVFDALKKLAGEAYFREAYLFGSVTKPYQFGEASDVDIAFEGLDPEKLFFSVGFLDRELGREVNAVLLENIPFREKILREGIKWKRN